MFERRIIALEERLAFQENELEKLNRVVADQQLELDAAGKELRDLRARVRAAGGTEESERRTLEDDRPPHY
ncbi:MAG: SlyX family protein [Planctomycetes bacterium]|nr:SlyX family protein [Planctomycetota bacterium]